MKIYTEDDKLLLTCIKNPKNKKGLTIGKTYIGCGCSLSKNKEVWVHINDKGNNSRYPAKYFIIWSFHE